MTKYRVIVSINWFNSTQTNQLFCQAHSASEVANHLVDILKHKFQDYHWGKEFTKTELGETALVQSKVDMLRAEIVPYMEPQFFSLEELSL